MNNLTLEIVRDLEAKIRQDPDVPKERIDALVADPSLFSPHIVQFEKQGYTLSAEVINYDGHFFYLRQFTIKDEKFKHGDKEEWLSGVVVTLRDMFDSLIEYEDEQQGLKRHFFTEQIGKEKDSAAKYRVIEANSNGEIKIYTQEYNSQTNETTIPVTVYKRRALGEAINHALDALGYDETELVLKPSFRDLHRMTYQDLASLLDPFENDPDKAFSEITTDVVGSYNLSLKLRQVAIDPISSEPVYELFRIELEDPEESIYGDEANDGYDDTQLREINGLVKRLNDQFRNENREANFTFTDHVDGSAYGLEPQMFPDTFDDGFSSEFEPRADDGRKYADKKEVSFTSGNAYAIRFYREEVPGKETDAPLLLTKSQILVLANALMSHNHRSKISYGATK